MTDQEDLFMSPDGWVTLPQPAGGGTHLRMEKSADGRYVITDVYVHGPEVTPSVLQAVPAGLLDTLMNNSLRYPHVKDRDLGDPLLAELRARAEQAHESGAPTLDRARIKPPPPRPTLTRPDGKSPDEFYALVARAYQDYAPRTRAPAAEIAREADVPVGTAHGWVREARRRGHLPPGRKGKAG